MKDLKYIAKCLGIDGGFADWSEPGSCTKPCGKGVRLQTRSCTNPKPSFNGRDCSGETKRLYPYWCNSQVGSRINIDNGVDDDSDNIGGVLMVLRCRMVTDDDGS